MAVGHSGFNPQTEHGRELREGLDWVENGRERLRRHRDTLIQMKDSGQLGSYAVSKYGWTDVAAAIAGLAELESALGQLDAAGVKAALDQLFAKLR